LKKKKNRFDGQTVPEVINEFLGFVTMVIGVFLLYPKNEVSTYDRLQQTHRALSVDSDLELEQIRSV